MGLDKFSAALDLLKGFNVNLYVGEDVFKGKLIGVETDHVVLETDKKYIFYYNIEKIQAVTKNTKLFQPEKSTVTFQKTQSLKELLHTFQHSWVTILSLYKQKFSGVLSEIDEDFATLINGEERILIKLTHISNILKGFIKEETKSKDTKSKVSSSKESKEEGKSKNDTKDKEKETKEEVPVVCETKEYTAEKMQETYSKPVIKVTHNSSEKKAKTQPQREKVEKEPEVCESVEVVDSNYKMVWSQPIKSEALDTKIEEDSSKGKTHQSVGETIEKPKSDMKQKEKEQEEPTLGKSKSVEPKKEKKQAKEASVKVETKAVPQNKEIKGSKFHETTPTSKPMVSHNAAPKKAENAPSDKNSNDTKNVWKQKDQEKRAFRFTGEPVARNSERAFPFAGWPNPSNNKRSFRF